MGDAEPELAHAPGDAPRQRLGAEAAGDLDRLDQRLLLVEQRQHQRPVVRPAHLAEGVGGAAASRAAASRRAAPTGGSSDSTSIPATAAQAATRIAHQPANLVRGRIFSSSFPNRSTGIGAPRVSAHSVASSSDRHDPLQLARAIGLRREVGQPLGRVRVAAPNGQLGQDRLGEQLDD